MASRDSCASPLLDCIIARSWRARPSGLVHMVGRFYTQPSFTQCDVLSPLPVGGNRHTVIASLQLSATDVSARTTMKGAAKCDKHCELQNSVNQ